MPRLHDPGIDAEAVAALGGGDQLYLVDVEAELGERPEAGGDAKAFRSVQLGAC